MINSLMLYYTYYTIRSYYLFMSELYIIKPKYMTVSMSIRPTTSLTSSLINWHFKRLKYLPISTMLSFSKALLGSWKDKSIVYALLKYSNLFINILIYFQIASLSNWLNIFYKNSFSNSFCIGVLMLDFSFIIYLFIEFIIYIKKKKPN